MMISKTNFESIYDGLRTLCILSRKLICLEIETRVSKTKPDQWNHSGSQHHFHIAIQIFLEVGVDGDTTLIVVLDGKDLILSWNFVSILVLMLGQRAYTVLALRQGRLVTKQSL